jgi:hypothetical protein
MIDIATVVFDQELSQLKAQAHSVALYCQHIGVKNIYVILNDHDSVAQHIDPAWWGDLAPRVIVIPRTVFSVEFDSNGWLSQQVLKILVAGLSYNTWTMVLDAKTVFVRQLNLHELIDDQGRIAVGSLDIYPVFERSKQIVDQLYNIDLTRQLGPGGVPFFFHNDVVRLMIAETTFTVKQTFPQWFQTQGMLTEFILYSGYLTHRFGGFDGFYAPESKVHACNICHSEVEKFDQKFEEMHESAVTTVSIHRNAWNKLTVEQQQQYSEFLLSKGIVYESPVSSSAS